MDLKKHALAGIIWAVVMPVILSGCTAQITPLSSSSSGQAGEGAFSTPQQSTSKGQEPQSMFPEPESIPNPSEEELPLAEVPGSYLEPATQQGRVVRLDYQSNTYDSSNQSLSKYAFVYLPYGYDDNDWETKYNILYLMHGGGGTADRYLGGENSDRVLKRILDNMIESGDIAPTIVVTPTFYHDDRSGPEGALTANFHHELLNDLLPAVESTYHTYASSSDEEGLKASREHRAFGGFSMGSVTTWYTFLHGLDYFKYYLPISGDCWVMGQMGGSDAGHRETAAHLHQMAVESGYSNRDYFIYAATGTDDIAYDPLTEQIEAMKEYTDTFVYSQDFSQGNFYYGVVLGGVHNNTYMNQYIYNALPNFWHQTGETVPSASAQIQEDAMTYAYQTETIYAQRDDSRIYGVAYIPRNAGEKLPAVIFSHGFGGSYRNGERYAEALAEQGYFVYCFDFCGGGYGSRSDGDVLDMSIFTEQADLEAVLAMISGRTDVDSENIFLAGASQGGAVSAITAAANPDAVRGAILLYPAFVLVDDAKEHFDQVEDIPPIYTLLGMRVGRAYAEKLLDYDIYEAISGYEKDVLILHGDADSIVPLSYSQRAVEVYPSATLKIFPGAGHGFYGADDQRAIQLALEYLDSHKNG